MLFPGHTSCEINCADGRASLSKLHCLAQKLIWQVGLLKHETVKYGCKIDAANVYNGFSCVPRALCGRKGQEIQSAPVTCPAHDMHSCTPWPPAPSAQTLGRDVGPRPWVTMSGPGSAGRLTEPQRGASPPALVLPLVTESAAPPVQPTARPLRRDAHRRPFPASAAETHSGPVGGNQRLNCFPCARGDRPARCPMLMPRCLSAAPCSPKSGLPPSAYGPHAPRALRLARVRAWDWARCTAKHGDPPPQYPVAAVAGLEGYLLVQGGKGRRVDQITLNTTCPFALPRPTLKSESPGIHLVYPYRYLLVRSP